MTWRSWRRLGGDPKAATDLPPIDFSVIDVSFDALPDATERACLLNLPTSLFLSSESVDRLRAAAAQLLRDSATFRKLVQHLPPLPAPQPSARSAHHEREPCHDDSGDSLVKPVRWGIVSTALIGTEKMIPAMRKSALLEVAAIASRSLAAAEAAAAKLGIATAHGSYEALLADPTIEAVYNPLPNHLHVPLTLAAVRAGKHVLCEKPMALTAAELDVLRPYATQVHIREAFMVRCHPQWTEVRERARNGEIGELRYIQIPFSYFNADPNDIRNKAEIGGGALYDIGCYAIAAGRWFFEGEPERVIAMVDRDPVLATDRTASGLLDFGGGRQLAFTVSTQSVRYQRIQLVGTRGRIEIEVPFNAPQGAATRYWIDRNGALDGSGMEQFTVAGADQYQLLVEAFSRAVRNERPDATGLDDAQANMRVIDALFAAAASSGPGRRHGAGHGCAGDECRPPSRGLARARRCRGPTLALWARCTPATACAPRTGAWRSRSTARCCASCRRKGLSCRCASTRTPSRAWPSRAQAAASRAAQALIEAIATWPRSTESWGLLHDDLHPWNLVYTSGEAGAIDFSDCGRGWRALDFASTLQYLQHPLAGNHDHRARLLEGYAEGRPLWPGAERQIDAMMLARWLNTVEWVLNDWPRIDLRAFGPGLLREVVPILELASIASMRGCSTQPRNQQETAWPSDSF